MKLQNKRVLVTGANGMVAYQLIKLLRDKNCNLTLTDLHEKSKFCNDEKYISGDLRDNKTIQSLFDISKGKISVLVNNAAIPCYGLPLDEMDENKILESLESNLISSIFLTQKIYPLLKKQGYGSIININSIVGKEPKKFRSIHSATKWGLRGFSKSLRIEAEENGIKVINVYPSRIKTVAEFTYGLEPEDVAEQIYKEYINSENNGELTIDGRPEEYR